jgi:hypothetical protein
VGIIFQARISALGLPVYGETARISFVVSSSKFWNFGRDKFSNPLRGYLKFTFFVYKVLSRQKIFHGHLEMCAGRHGEKY